MSTPVYAQYAWQEEYADYPQTFGEFGIIICDETVLIKQRNGKGGSPYLFDLPGGGVKPGESHEDAVVREVWEEVKLRVKPEFRIGSPLWMPIKKDGKIVRVDCAQAWLLSSAVFGQNPSCTDEAINLEYVDEKTMAGFNIVSRTADPDPSKRVLGRTPIMLLDGLSITKEPFYSGEVPSEVPNLASHPVKRSTDYLPIDNGNYLARFFKVPTPVDPIWHVEIYYRLNPDQPEGRFKGSLEHLNQGPAEV